MILTWFCYAEATNTYLNPININAESLIDNSRVSLSKYAIYVLLQCYS